MAIIPTALYSSLLTDLSTVLSKEDLLFWKQRKDYPVGATTKEVAAIQIARSLLKKFEYPNNDLRDSAALLKFLNVNKRCEEWKLELASSWDEILYGELKRALWRFWHQGNGYPLVDHPYDLLSKGSIVGPGASIRGGGGDIYSKIFDSELSSTSSYLTNWYRRYVRNFAEWSNAEETRQCHRGDALVKGNRLDFVPKNDETSRTICVEPTLNMFYQLGLSYYLEKGLKDQFGINLADQQFKNRELARRGSVEDSFATIDLESASDSLSRKMLQEVLPDDLYRLLDRLRSPLTDVPGLGYIETGMISTMGNGYTFSLQTVLFSCVVVACFRARGVEICFPRGVCWGNFGVNGDDIVVPREIAGDVIRLLNILGFLANKDKTFLEGPFRESCGGDFWLGRFVRGVYVKRLDSEQDRYSAINQLNQFTYRTGIVLTHTVQLLLASVKWLPVPRWEDDSSGVRVPFSLVNQPVHIGFQSPMYWCWVPHTKKYRIAEAAIFIPKGSRPRRYNPSGLLLSFLQGAVNSCAIGLRQKDRVTYGRKRRIAPNWDVRRVSHPLSGWEPEDERWNTSVYLNVS